MCAVDAKFFQQVTYVLKLITDAYYVRCTTVHIRLFKILGDSRTRCSMSSS